MNDRPIRPILGNHIATGQLFASVENEAVQALETVPSRSQSVTLRAQAGRQADAVTLASVAFRARSEIKFFRLINPTTTCQIL